MTRQEHWEAAYRTTDPADLSWFQSHPTTSLEFIAATGLPRDTGIIDVGGGSSTLIDFLLKAGYGGLAVLDLSATALGYARARLGQRSAQVEWFEADVISFEPTHRFGIWHDRAVFHFLPAPSDRRSYVATLLRTLRPGGQGIIATFAPDGPSQCSGLEVARYDENSIKAELGPTFLLRDSRRETHTTPWETEQHFVFFRFEHIIHMIE